jgi:glycosyltransferase involved in cell wall biosynthesis
VAHCLLVFEPPDGGVAEHVRQLAVGLDGRGWRVTVSGPRESMIYPALDRAGVPVVRLPLRRGFAHPAHDLAALGRLLRLVRRLRPDLVHLHSSKAGVLGRLAAGSVATPSVYTPHCFPFVGRWRPPRRRFALGVERALGRSTAAIVCVAEQERRLALDNGVGKPDTLRVVPNATQPCEADAEPDPDLEAFAREGPLAACVAALRPQKSIDVFIDAAPLVLDRLPDARLAVVGDGPLRDKLQARAVANRLDHRLRFFAFRPPPARQLRSLDLFVLPSSWEGLPIAILEAQACGVPQVATDVGGSAEAVADGETGLLCPPRDPAALADRIVELLSDDRRREAMAAASRARYEREFTVETMLDRVERVYSEVLSARDGAG